MSAPSNTNASKKDSKPRLNRHLESGGLLLSALERMCSAEEHRECVSMLSQLGDSSEASTTAVEEAAASAAASAAAPENPDAQTENAAAAFSTTGHPSLDLFFEGMVRGASPEAVGKMVATAWAGPAGASPVESALTCVRVLMNGRDARDGKGERLVVRHALRWMREFKPRTYVLNLYDMTVTLGYFKDLLLLAVEAEEAGLEKLGEREFVELELFVSELKRDLESLHAWKRACAALDDGAEQPAAPSLSLAGKWAPSQGKQLDKKAKLARRMARLMFPEDSRPLAAYRRALSELRQHLVVVERLASAGEWEKIEFGKVPSTCHRVLRKAFVKHQKERYEAYLEGIKRGTEVIKSAGTQPHDLIRGYIQGEDLDETLEAQWSAVIDGLREKGALTGSISIVDVSGSMSGTPMEVAIALGLLVAEMTEGAFHNHLITFSESPQWHTVQDGSTHAKVNSLKQADWGMSTNLEKSFQMILDMAVAHNVPPEALPASLFIFSDMQFDVAVRGQGNMETIFEAARRNFEQAGYTFPNIIFWNLRATPGKSPVSVNSVGVAAISGFSPQLLKVFLDGKQADLSPMSVMYQTLEPYKVYAKVHPSEVEWEQ